MFTMNTNKQYSNSKNFEFRVSTLSDIEKIPVDTKELIYFCKEAINFPLPKKLRRLYLSNEYMHSLDFLKNTNVITLGVPDNDTNDLSSIPETIQTLQLYYLSRPLSNIPSTIKKIFIFFEPETDLIFKSKIPYGCEIFYGGNYNKFPTSK